MPVLIGVDLCNGVIYLNASPFGMQKEIRLAGPGKIRQVEITGNAFFD